MASFINYKPLLELKMNQKYLNLKLRKYPYYVEPRC